MKICNIKENLIFEKTKDMHQFWQAIILQPFKQEECTLYFGSLQSSLIWSQHQVKAIAAFWIPKNPFRMTLGFRGGPKLRFFGRRPKLFSLCLRPPKLSRKTFGLSFYPKLWLLLDINFELEDNFDLQNLFWTFWIHLALISSTE